MKQRLIAAAIHFLGSAGVISMFLLLVYFIWYAYPYNIIYSAIDVVKLVVGVDLVLGPLLTLVIFNISKPRKELIRDITIIVCFQVAALSWGVHAAYKVRPLYAVYYGGTFYTATGADIDIQGSQDAIASPGILEKAKVVYVKKLEKHEAVVREIENMRKGMRGIMYRPQEYELISHHIDEIVEHNLDVNNIAANSEKKAIDKVIQQRGKALSEFLFYPYVSGVKGGSGIVVIDKSEMKIVDVLK
ncbi:MAG: hypothetical protein OEY61_04200 [Gammaproteobacteria bacterium]|nr:hypothetical protein [Gammaproteobacteria bacterium]